MRKRPKWRPNGGQMEVEMIKMACCLVRENDDNKLGRLKLWPQSRGHWTVQKMSTNQSTILSKSLDNILLDLAVVLKRQKLLIFRLHVLKPYTHNHYSGIELLTVELFLFLFLHCLLFVFFASLCLLFSSLLFPLFMQKTLWK